MKRFALIAGLSFALVAPAQAGNRTDATPSWSATDWSQLVDDLQALGSGDLSDLSRANSIIDGLLDFSIDLSTSVTGDLGQQAVVDQAKSALDLAFGMIGALDGIDDNSRRETQGRKGKKGKKGKAQSKKTPGKTSGSARR